MLVDHLFRYRISPWPKTVEKRSFCTGFTDGRTDGPTDGPSYRDATAHLKILIHHCCICGHKDRRTDRPSYTEGYEIQQEVGVKSVAPPLQPNQSVEQWHMG